MVCTVFEQNLWCDTGGLNRTKVLPALEEMVHSELGAVGSDPNTLPTVLYADTFTRLHLRAVPFQGSAFSYEDMTAIVADFFDVEHNAVKMHTSNPVGSRIPQHRSVRVQGASSATQGCPITIEFPTGRTVPVTSVSGSSGLLETPKLNDYEIQTGILVYRPSEGCQSTRTDLVLEFGLQAPVASKVLSPLSTLHTMVTSAGVATGHTPDLIQIFRLDAGLDMSDYDLIADMHRSACIVRGCRKIQLLSSQLSNILTVGNQIMVGRNSTARRVLQDWDTDPDFIVADSVVRYISDSGVSPAAEVDFNLQENIQIHYTHH